MTSNDADIGIWVVKMTVKLVTYPLVTIDEYFAVEIDSCKLNSLTLSNPYNYPLASPYTFSLYGFFA